ncbi:hypothetical protein BDW22DRAFT_1433025 [Trametopsis cervina]|nr:hypothetical protein BDW22DRAFT_1433025 [Trametopsis cervina]
MISLSTIEDAVKVVKLLKELIGDWKKAPEAIKLLEIEAAAVETLLLDLGTHHSRSLDGIAEEGARVGELDSLVRRHLKEIEKFLEEVQMKSPSGTVRVKKRVWLWKKISGDDVKELSSQLAALRGVLYTMAASTLIQSSAQHEQTLVNILQTQRATKSDPSVAHQQPTPAAPVPQQRYGHSQSLEGCHCVYQNTTATDQASSI